MKAQQVRLVLVSHEDLAALQTAWNKLMAGEALTPAESGVVAVESIRDMELVGGVPPLLFDGVRYTQALYVTTG